MLKKSYARWMYKWETRLTTRDENRVVRPLEWGLEWMEPFLANHHLGGAELRQAAGGDEAAAEDAIARINHILIARSDEFFGYERPTDFRLEQRFPQLFPTNVRPETLAQDAQLRRRAENGEIERAQFLRFTSPE